VTSVCTGSLALGAAGLLRGKRAACHWAWRDTLALFGATPDPSRVVRDGNIVTGGGVTAGIDFALSLVAEIAGTEVAQAIQLQIEYAPAPPFEAGSPETAPPAILAHVREQNAATAWPRREAVEAAARRLKERSV
jgi:transcriptional regulator GlxA family with amidase domain